MADQGKVVITMKATEAIARGRLVDVDGALTASRAIGVAIDSIDSGAYGPVQISGTALVVASAEITKGALFKSNADGKAVTITGEGTDLNQACGQALETAAADGVLFNAKIF